MYIFFTPIVTFQTNTKLRYYWDIVLLQGKIFRTNAFLVSFKQKQNRKIGKTKTEQQLNPGDHLYCLQYVHFCLCLIQVVFARCSKWFFHHVVIPFPLSTSSLGSLTLDEISHQQFLGYMLAIYNYVTCFLPGSVLSSMLCNMVCHKSFCCCN